MAKDEQGFMDWLVEDIANTIEIKGAVEATRDENGKVDKWAATGLAMGLGHTSDDEMATLAGFLGAEGAFDNDNDNISNDFDDIFVPITTSRYTTGTVSYMSEAEYERKKQDANSNFKISIWLIAIAAIGIFIGLISGIGEDSDSFGIVCLVAFAVLGWGVYYSYNQKNQNLEKIEKEYSESCKMKKQEEAKRKQQEVAKKEFEVLRNYAGTTDFCTAINSVFKKAKSLFDEADKACDINEPSYNRVIIENLLTFILYFAIKDCKITSKQKSATFDLAMCWCCIHSDFTGDMLFLEHHSDLTETLQKALDEIYSLITVAVHKSDQTGADMDFTKTLCSMMILLGEEFDKQFTPKGLGASGVHIILETARRAAQRVIDERLLDDPAEEPTVCDDSADSNVNMESVMNKVEKLASDNDFLSRKLAGKEFEITCDSCKNSVKITVTSELTGKCPICGYENKLTFSVK